MPAPAAKTIQIYLPDGNARGVRVAEVTSRAVQAVQIPWPELTAAAGVVLGRSSSGWRAWTNADGRSLDELERQ